MSYMLKKLKNAEARKENARGLAVIFYNSYENDKKFKLTGTIKDGKAMSATFDSLGFATLSLSDVDKEDVGDIIGELASYKEHPEEYNCFAIYFAGHGDRNNMLMGSDKKYFNFEEVIIQRFNKRNYDVADIIAKVPILVFIDACRGSTSPRVAPRIVHEDLAPKNVLVAYATAEKYMALEAEGGGIWTQKLAAELCDSGKSVKDILEDVKNAMPEDYKKDALPVTWNANSAAGNIKLKESAGGDTERGEEAKDEASGAEKFGISVQSTKGTKQDVHQQVIIQTKSMPGGFNHAFASAFGGENGGTTAGSTSSGRKRTVADGGEEEIEQKKAKYVEEKDTNPARHLSDHDINKITVELMEVSNRWKDIGLCLGFTESELANIGDQHNIKFNDCLSKMLSNWGQWAPKDARGSTCYATLESIKAALNKIGLGKKAEELNID